MEGPDRPIFVLGCPRSGTTLVRTMLHAHPRIAVAPETRYLMRVYHGRAFFGDLERRENRERLARWIVGNRARSRFGVLGLDGEEIVREIVDGPPTLGSAFGVILRAYARRFGKPRWGDKRPAYYSFMDELDTLFPDAQFVHVVRDPRAVVESLKRQSWYPEATGPCAAAWVHAVRSARRSGAKLGPSRYHEIRYEELVTDPEAVIRRACEFLDEPFAEEMCRPEQVVDRVVAAGYGQHQQIQAGVNTDFLYAWREKLPPNDIALVERTARGTMKRLGYEPSSLGGHAPLQEVVSATWDRTRLSRRLLTRRFGDARRHAYSNNSVAARLTSLELADRRAEPTLGSRALRVARPVIGPATRTVRRAVRARRRRRDYRRRARRLGRA